MTTPISIFESAQSLAAVDAAVLAAQSVYIRDDEPPRTAMIFFAPDGDATKVVTQRVQVTSLAQGEMQCVGEVVSVLERGEVRGELLLYKSATGETWLNFTATITEVVRTDADCRYGAKLRTLRRNFKSAARIFALAVADNNVALWNDWCAPLTEGVVLRNLHCPNANLSGYDFCCAELVNCDWREVKLTDANLAGADLTRCQLNGAVVLGADLFGATLPTRYENFIAESGLIEIESVKLR
jgi:hypothetical protein